MLRWSCLCCPGGAVSLSLRWSSLSPGGLFVSLYRGKKVCIASKALFAAARPKRGYWDLANTISPAVCWLRRFQLLYLSRNAGSSIYTVDQFRLYK